MLSEADVVANVAPTAAASGALQYADPVMISMIRRTMPNLMAFDILGVQPMTGPTGLIFAMKSNYSTQGGTEALHDEAFKSPFPGTALPFTSDYWPHIGCLWG